MKRVVLLNLILILAVHLFSCSFNEENIDLSQIVVNTRKESHKIHKISCAYVNKMAEHNKWYPNKTIEELVRDGYVPCDICLVKAYKKYIKSKNIATNSNIRIDENEEKRFVDCISDVAEYYLGNVYTYQGAHKYKREIENMAQKASKKAYDKWKSEKSKYGESEYVMTAVSDEININGKYINDDAIYNCKKIAEIEIKGNKIVDDCSKFVACVYYYYLMQKGQVKEANQISIVYEGTSKFSNAEAKINALLSKCKFKTYSIEDIKHYDDGYEKGLKNREFTLKSGDMIYRRQHKNSDGTIKPAHVEFVIDESHVFGWGQVQAEYPIKKVFSKTEKGFVSDYDKDEGLPYTLVIRLEDE